jgi:tetratricopeptide (TPR) repeat protein
LSAFHAALWRLPACLVAAIFFASAGTAAPSSADPWYVHYENGERALGEGDWRRAVSELGEAIERRADSGVRLRTTGSRLVNYFPYLKLGAAYVELGDFDAALQAFDTEERLGIAIGVPTAWSELQAGRARASAARSRAAEDAAALAARRGDILRQSLTRARELRDEGRFDDAMVALAPGLAVAPDDADALAFMEALQNAAAREGSPPGGAEPSTSGAAGPPNTDPRPAPAEVVSPASSASSPDVERRLAAAENDLAAGRSEQALVGANRVLALDRGNRVALDIVRRAYGEISRRLLGPSAGSAPQVGAPPLIRFANSRVASVATGEMAERVEVAAHVLSGVAIGRSAVTVEAFDVDGTSPRPLALVTSSQSLGDTFITEFRLERRLAAGRTSVLIVARDAEGRSARSDFVVTFERPWYRSPLVALFGLVLAAAAAAALVLRARSRRRALVERRFNPYVAGGPVFDLGLFHGREALIRRVLQTVHNNSLMLHGERRIGKTTLLHQIRRRLEALEDPEFRFHAVYIDLQGTAEERLFATLADQVFEGLQTTSAVDELARRRTQALARAGYDHHDLVQELRGVLHALTAVRDPRGPRAVRLVLLIDEVDELNHYDPRVNQKLRSLFMKSFAENLVAVVAGVRIRKEWEREGSPWYNFFEEVAVESLDAAAARELVLAPIRGVFRLEPGAAEAIVEHCERKPFRIQKMCRALVNRLHESGRRTIRLSDVAAVAAVAAAAPIDPNAAS